MGIHCIFSGIYATLYITPCLNSTLEALLLTQAHAAKNTCFWRPVFENSKGWGRIRSCATHTTTGCEILKVASYSMTILVGAALKRATVCLIVFIVLYMWYLMKVEME